MNDFLYDSCKTLLLSFHLLSIPYLRVVVVVVSLNLQPTQINRKIIIINRALRYTHRLFLDDAKKAGCHVYVEHGFPSLFKRHKQEHGFCYY